MYTFIRVNVYMTYLVAVALSSFKDFDEPHVKCAVELTHRKVWGLSPSAEEYP